MAIQTTVELCQKVRKLLGCDVKATERLAKLDEDILELCLIKNNAKLKIETIKKRSFFGFSQATQSEHKIDIDEGVLLRVIEYYEDEYIKQVDVCKELIRKLESEEKEDENE